MQKYFLHKNIYILLSAIFSVIGIFSFALNAEAAYVTACPYNFPTADFTLTTLPTSVFLTSERKSEFNALYSAEYASYHQKKVLDEVNSAFSSAATSFGVGASASAKQDVIAYDTAYDAACQDAKEWREYEASCAWVTVNVYDDDGVKTGTKQVWQCTKAKPISTGYSSSDNYYSANNAYPDIGTAEQAEATSKTELESALNAYSYELNIVVKDSVKGQVAYKKTQETAAATELATETYNTCIAAATTQTARNACDTEKQKALEIAAAETQGQESSTTISLEEEGKKDAAYIIKQTYVTCIASAKDDASKEQLCEDKKTIALDAAGMDEGEMNTLTAGETITAQSAVSTTLTPDQQAQAAALLANQEMASPKEMELLAALKEGCYKINPLSMNCLAQLPYYFIYKPASWLLIIAGYMFDASLSLSIDKEFVNQPFVKESWTVIRDFSNMLFIFILLYTGIQTILGLGDWRKTVLHIVIIALLINFSLFFTKVVIDAGNILAVGVFQAIGTEKNDLDKLVKKVSGGVPERNISGALVASFSPQKFLEKTGKVNEWNAVIVFLIAASVNAVAAYVLFKVALVFIGRLLAFWVLMILSPFAFISFTLKGDANIFGWYTSTLISQAFVAPVFLFLLYLVMTVISAGGGIMSAFAK
ncbi:MAG: hypothetical protein AAB497_03140 [Patescibacteria group bacterium]